MRMKVRWQVGARKIRRALGMAIWGLGIASFAQAQDQPVQGQPTSRRLPSNSENMGAPVAQGLEPPASRAVVQENAAAQALFEEGKQLLAQDKYVEACQLLERSQAIVPGVGIRLYLAECYRLGGRLASAWVTFQDAAAAARSAQDNREAVARRRAAELKEKLSWLSLAVDAESLSIPGFSVFLNGESISNSMLGIAFPVDSGRYIILAKASGYLDFGMQVDVGSNASRHSLAIPRLARIVPVPVPSPSPSPSPVPRSLSVGPSENESPPYSDLEVERHHGFSESRATGPSWVGISLLGAGLFSAGVGVVSGIRSLRNESTAEGQCGLRGTLCSQAGLDSIDKAQGAALVANVSYSVAVALLLGGGLVYYLDNRRPGNRASAVRSINAVPWVDARSVGAQFLGEF